ncbi:hypothetical protein NHN12_14825 [Lactiplantibacillus plantarum]|uniref:hypothetical protein n=1 Tax=Lactiplantibacillus plantarum TaxID=1590 RepID=UPI00209D7720|nr:hypothetical protein [Lactiplantibacillus plantarum]USZ60678.1 hypothetical protein NHN12_14825 [Lactiplantibacillus plantarum]
MHNQIVTISLNNKLKSHDQPKAVRQAACKFRIYGQPIIIYNGIQQRILEKVLTKDFASHD